VRPKKEWQTSKNGKTKGQITKSPKLEMDKPSIDKEIPMKEPSLLEDSTKDIEEHATDEGMKQVNLLELKGIYDLEFVESCSKEKLVNFCKGCPRENVNQKTI
jgi:hypothetical protein